MYSQWGLEGCLLISQGHYVEVEGIIVKEMGRMNFRMCVCGVGVEGRARTQVRNVSSLELVKKTWKNEASTRREGDKGHVN